MTRIEEILNQINEDVNFIVYASPYPICGSDSETGRGARNLHVYYF